MRAADSDPALFAAQPPEDLVTDSTEDPYEYAQGFSVPHCPDNGIETKASSSGHGTGSDSPPPPPAEDKNVCHGVGGDYWVMSRDVAIDNVKDFCGQTDHTKKYNGGSVNELELSVKKLDDDTKSPEDSPDCVGRFTNAVIDGCDGNDPVNNPFNYKFGATLTSGDGWEYKMTPLSQQVNEVACDVSYKFWYDGVEVRGKNWADAKLGVNGEGLLAELRGCGEVTEWHFERTPDDCCFQWYASGQLPIGTKNCVGSAVQTAGGSSAGSCWGAGKRGLTRRGDNIDNWPGYGGDWRHIFTNNTDFGAAVLEGLNAP